MFLVRKVLGGLLLSAALAACSSGVKLGDSEVPIESRTPTLVAGSSDGPSATTGSGSGAVGSGAAQSQVTTVDLARGAAAVDSRTARLVYFDFDSYVLRDEARPVIEAHAKALSADRKQRLVVEGHTDDRGGREYNLSLGQKRAEAVLKALVLLGVQDAQVEAVSFGMERPASAGSDESAWAQNRRAELRNR